MAVKLLRGPHDLRRHRLEMEALTRIRHPGLVALHDGGVDEDGVPYLVLDLVDGPTLAERLLLGGPLAPEAVRRLGARVAGALAAVHAAGVVHRDVKPANVLLDPDGTPWLTDLGIARVLDATSVTRTGAVLGTAGFLAPEQVRGDRVTPAADVYALGLVLLEALTGRREYPGSVVESATARLHRAPAVPRDVPAPLARALRAMTDTDPARRPTAAAAAALLAGEPGTSPIPVWSRAVAAHRRLLAGVTVLAVVVGAVGAVLLGRVPSAPAPTPAAAPALALVVPEPVPAVPAPSATPAGSGPSTVTVEEEPERSGPPATRDGAPARTGSSDAAPGRGGERAGDDRPGRSDRPEKAKPGKPRGSDGGHGRGRSGRGRN